MSECRTTLTMYTSSTRMAPADTNDSRYTQSIRNPRPRLAAEDNTETHRGPWALDRCFGQISFRSTYDHDAAEVSACC